MGNDYWPSPLRHIANENLMDSQLVTVAEIGKPWGEKSHWQSATALVPVDKLNDVLSNPGGIGTNVRSRQAHPYDGNDLLESKPRFTIWAGDIVPKGLEPLTVSWTAGSKTILAPDQGFLMTYNLSPRAVKSDDGDIIHWDDLEHPKEDVVVSKMTSEYYYELKTVASVCIDRDYVYDYAYSRNLAMVQVYYASNTDVVTSEDMKVLSGKDFAELNIEGRKIDIRLDSSELNAQIWGVRLLCLPEKAPITEGQWDFGSLKWPGIDEPVTKESAQALKQKTVYVDDFVLQYYEERPDKFTINPEHGSVSHGGQWSVGFSRRVGRSLIQLEIRKLYEGGRPDVVKHWHKFAVDPPVESAAKLREALNVALRSKKIVYLLAELGEILSVFADKLIPDNTLKAENFVKVVHSKLKYYGWWTGSDVIPIARHIKKGIGEDTFLSRCNDLDSFVVEGMIEKNIRKLIKSIISDQELLKKLRTVKLLDLLSQLSIICEETGICLFTESQEVEEIYKTKMASLEKDQHLDSPVSVIFLLKDLRNASAHKGKGLKPLLERLGTDSPSLKAGMGEQLDKLYDEIADSLEKINGILKKCLK